MSVADTRPCTCGHSPEEHGNSALHRNATNCDECGCIAYEADEDDAAPTGKDG